MSKPDNDGLKSVVPVRLDKWLWYARFFKTRSLATKFILSGKLRIGGNIVNKPHRQAQIGYVLTFILGEHTRVIKILDFGSRRGPAPEAQALYDDLAPLIPHNQKEDFGTHRLDFESRERGSGRPTKRERRDTVKLKDPLSSA